MTLEERYEEHCQLLKWIHSCIKRRATGTPDEFARRINLSKATLSRRLKDLEARGAVIKFDRDRGSYYYAQDSEPEI